MSDSISRSQVESFRAVLIRKLRESVSLFDFNELKTEHKASDEVACAAARGIFLSQCLSASGDGKISSHEKKILSKLADQLLLSKSERKKCLNAARNRVFQNELATALDDGVISKEEAATLEELRESLGLPKMERSEFGPKKKRRNPSKKRLRSHSEDDFTLKIPSPVFGIPYDYLLWILLPTLIAGGFSLYTLYKGGILMWPLCLILLKMGGIGSVLTFIWNFFFTRCKYCGEKWAVRLIKTHEVVTMSSMFSGGRWYEDTYHCSKCGQHSSTIYLSEH